MLHYNYISTFEAVLLTKNCKIEPPDLLFIGLFQKKPNRGGMGVEDMEFPSVNKKKQCRISRILGFWPWNFQGV